MKSQHDIVNLSKNHQIGRRTRQVTAINLANGLSHIVRNRSFHIVNLPRNHLVKSFESKLLVWPHDKIRIYLNDSLKEKTISNNPKTSSQKVFFSIMDFNSIFLRSNQKLFFFSKSRSGTWIKFANISEK